MKKYLFLAIFFVSLPFTSYGAITDGLSGYYKLDDETATFGGLNLTNNNSATFGSAKIDNGVILSGGNQYLSNGASVSTGNTSISVFAWVYINSASEAGAFMHNGNPAGWGQGYSLGVGNGTYNTSGNELIGLSDGYAWLPFGCSIGTGWHYVGMVLNTGTWSGYVDNTVCGTSHSGVSLAIPSGGFEIGREVDNAPAYFTGTVDELGIWDKSLSPDERAYLYNSGSGCTYPFSCSGGGTTTPPVISSTTPATDSENLHYITGILTILLVFGLIDFGRRMYAGYSK